MSREARFVALTAALWLGCAASSASPELVEDSVEIQDIRLERLGADSVEEVPLLPDTFDVVDLSEIDRAETPMDLGTTDISPLSPPGPEGELAAQVLLEGVYTDFNGATHPYQLLRLQVGEARATYAQWFPSTLEEPRPVVFLTQPYDIIDWTGEETDEAMALAGDVLTPDEAGDSAFLYMYHGANVLLVFGRFYTGHGIENEVDDMVTGFHFLREQPEVDRERIVIWGGSWGGFEAVYGAAYAPDDMKPMAGVGLAPLTDVEAQVRFWTDFVDETVTNPERLQQHQDFREPYLKRIYKTTGGHPDDPQSNYDFWRTEDLVTRLTSDFLIIHDTWDTLVPFEPSWNLVQALPGNMEGIWIFHEAEADWNALELGHGLLQTDTAYPAVYTLLIGYLLERIVDPGTNRVALFDPNDFKVFLSYLRSFQLQGKDMNWAAPRLLELGRPDVYLFDVNEEQDPVLGNVWIASTLSEIWGYEIPPETLPETLADGLPE